METSTKLELFEKVELKQSRRGGGEKVTISKYKNSIFIGKKLCEQVGLEVGTRFDLYRMGKTFALKKSTVGVLTAAKHGGCYCIRNTSACIEILAMNGRCYENEAWVERDVIFFRPIENVGE